MTQSSRHHEISRVIKAPRARVYRAFLDPQAVAQWFAPETMQVRIHHFDAREGGQFRISLIYQNPADARRGKSSGNTDTYHGHFVQLIPDEKIVEAIEFESDDPRFAGEMTMSVMLADAPAGTEVTLRYDDLPSGIRPEDNEAGTRSSLQKLARLVE